MLNFKHQNRAIENDCVERNIVLCIHSLEHDKNSIKKRCLIFQVVLDSTVLETTIITLMHVYMHISLIELKFTSMLLDIICQARTWLCKITMEGQLCMLLLLKVLRRNEYSFQLELIFLDLFVTCKKLAVVQNI